MSNQSIKVAIEPTLDKYPNKLAIYWSATRPPFILATIIPILLGTAYSFYKTGSINWSIFIFVLLAGAFLHAGVNVLNDYYDSLNGTDDFNTQRIYPFTGGSRFIQNEVLTNEQTRNFGIILMLLVVFIGFFLVLQVGVSLLVLGLFGMLIGWAYSAPPLKLNSRGLGELTVFIGFSLLPLGAWLSQTGELSKSVVLVGLPLGLLTSNLLYINQFPDRKADIYANKMHWVARFPTQLSRWGYVFIAISAWPILLVLIVFDQLPMLSLISLVPALLSAIAIKELFKYHDQPRNLEKAIKITLFIMLSHGVLLSLSLLY